MKKLLFAVFAHPDDEAFGPSGTLVLEARNGTEIHLITLTDGQAGQNIDNHGDLGAVRFKEWREAAALIGAKHTHHLGYQDGQLCNTALVDIQQRVIEIVYDHVTHGSNDYEIEFMTMDDNGITGHIDHTVASRAASFAYYRLKHQGLTLSRIRYACVPRDFFPAPSAHWIYQPVGRSHHEIDEVIDAREVLDTIYQIMRCHHTQRDDAEAHIASRGDKIAINHFIIHN